MSVTSACCAISTPRSSSVRSSSRTGLSRSRVAPRRVSGLERRRCESSQYCCNWRLSLALRVQYRDRAMSISGTNPERPPNLSGPRITLVDERYPVGPIGRKIIDAGGASRSIDPGGLGVVEVVASGEAALVPRFRSTPSDSGGVRAVRVLAGSTLWWGVVAALSIVAAAVAWTTDPSGSRSYPASRSPVPDGEASIEAPVEMDATEAAPPPTSPADDRVRRGRTRPPRHPATGAQPAPTVGVTHPPKPAAPAAAATRHVTNTDVSPRSHRAAAGGASGDAPASRRPDSRDVASPRRVDASVHGAPHLRPREDRGSPAIELVPVT